MGRLEQKVALVTGAAKGLGAAIAAAFVAEGARVVLCDIDRAGEDLSRELGGQAEFRRLDVRREAEWVRIMDEVGYRFGRLDILVNNAGVVRLGTIEDTLEADYREVMAVSADGAFFGCKHAVPLIARSGQEGSIINLSSINAIQGNPPVTAYCAAKGAVAALTRAVAAHCKDRGYGVRCNAILPSSIDTPMVRAVAGVRSGSASRAKLGAPEDVAHLAVYLASAESAFMTGQCLVLDDGASVMRRA